MTQIKGVSKQNFSSLTLKLREEFQVMNGQHFFPADPLLDVRIIVIFQTPLCLLIEITYKAFDHPKQLSFI